MHPEMGYKLRKFSENRARDTSLRGADIPTFDQISVKTSVLGSYTLIVAPMGDEIWRVEEGNEGPRLHAKFHSHRCNVSPLRGKNVKIGL